MSPEAVLHLPHQEEGMEEEVEEKEEEKEEVERNVISK